MTVQAVVAEEPAGVIRNSQGVPPVGQVERMEQAVVLAGEQVRVEVVADQVVRESTASFTLAGRWQQQWIPPSPLWPHTKRHNE